jgi:hypothetical protein
MPKFISDYTKQRIADFAKSHSQTEASRVFRVSRALVKSVISGRPVVTTKTKQNGVE